MRPIAIIVGISWILFWLYWIVSAFGSKKDIRPSNAKVFFGSRLGVLVVAAILALTFDHLPPSFRDYPLGSDVTFRLIGLIIFITGFVLAVWARVAMGREWGMPMTEKQKPKLIESGPYHYIRHPIYTGILTMAVTSAIDVNAYWLLVFVVSAVYFVYSAFMEERMLTRQFGKRYEQYKRRTKMLIPFFF